MELKKQSMCWIDYFFIGMIAVLLLECAVLATAQTPKPFDPSKTMSRLKGSVSGHYGTFTITTIPQKCQHPHVLNGVETCRIFVRYPNNLQIAKPMFYIEDWTDSSTLDHSQSKDTIYHVALYKPDRQGVYIEGRPGHRIWWQVNSQ